tara:strand:- start:113 stop:334 length:222 start_codon:yes stop_codon:yes gene_type:complete
MIKDNSRAFYKALVSHYEAERDEAVAILEVYFNNSIGIGEHSNILDELKKWVTKLSDAREALDVLEKNFSKFK